MTPLQEAQLTYTLTDSNGDVLDAPHAIQWSIVSGEGFIIGLNSGLLRAQFPSTITVRGQVFFFGQAVASGPTATCEVQVNP